MFLSWPCPEAQPQSTVRDSTNLLCLLHNRREECCFPLFSLTDCSSFLICLMASASVCLAITSVKLCLCLAACLCDIPCNCYCIDTMAFVIHPDCLSVTMPTCLALTASDCFSSCCCLAELPWSWYLSTSVSLFIHDHVLNLYLSILFILTLKQR